MKRFLSTRAKAGGQMDWEVWEVCDDQQTADFLHIRRVAIVPKDWLRLIDPELFQQQLLLGTEVKA